MRRIKIAKGFAISSIVLILLLAIAHAEDIYVSSEGDCNYTSIQAAINNASSGDAIWVKAGSYYENINVNRSNIFLEGYNFEDSDQFLYPIIYGCCNGTALVLSEKGITLEGFQIIGSNIGILVDSSDNWIGFNFIENNTYGIRVTACNNKNNSIVVNNFKGNEYGVYIENSIENNVVQNIFKDDENSIYLILSNSNSLDHNSISGSKKIAVQMISSDSNQVLSNTIDSSSNGLIAENSYGNLIDDNGFTNTKNICFDNGSNRWYKCEPRLGNYYGTLNYSWNSVYQVPGGRNIGLYPKPDNSTLPIDTKRRRRIPH
jgi:parallel beta-helix repeat protein